MFFLIPSHLWLLVFAVIPIVLYILFRRRRTEVSWGATYILRLALASGRRRSLWRQIVVIALRTVMLAALALAFARPFRETSQPADDGPFPRGQGRLHRIVLLDNSLSMQARHGFGSRIDLAREALVELLVSMQSGDVFDLVLLSPESPDASPSAIRISCPVSAAEARRIGAEIHPTAVPSQFVSAMRTAVESFRTSVVATRQLVLISDMARVDHPAVNDYSVFGEMLELMDVRAAVYDLGAREAHNLAIERVGTGVERLYAGQIYNIYVDVMNYSDTPFPPTRLDLFVNGEPRGSSTCELPAGHRRIYSFETSFAPGQHSVEARIGRDAYEADNRMERFVHVEPRMRLLLVDEDEENRFGFERESAFLVRALEAAAHGPSLMEADIVKAADFGPDVLHDKDVVILFGGAQLQDVDLLRRFVLQGGGVVMALGPNVDPLVFNRLYGELLPAELDAAHRETFDPERYVSIRTDDIVTNMLREFRTGENGDLTRARVYNHYRLRPGTERSGEAERMLSLANGDPLLIARRLGRGRVFLWTTTLGGNWTSLPVHQVYIPFVSRLFGMAAGDRIPPRNVHPADPLILEVGDADATVFMTTPEAELRRLEVWAADHRGFVRVEDAMTPGVYVFSDADGKHLASFSVAMPLTQSDLRTLSDREREHCSAALHAVWADSGALLRSALWRPGDGHEYTVWLFALVLGLLLLDGLLTRLWFTEA